MKYNPWKFVDQDDTPVPTDIPKSPDVPQDYKGNPMILRSKVWKNTVINFERLTHGERRTLSRVACYGQVVFSNKKGKIVAKGDLRDLNEKSGGFEINHVELKLNDILYLEFLDHSHLIMNQVKVTLKRIEIAGSKIKVGVEFLDATIAFQDKLDNFLAEKRSELGQFEELENF